MDSYTYRNVDSLVSNTSIVYTVQVFPTLELFNEEKGSVMVQFKGSSNAPSFDFLCIRPAAGVRSLSVNTIIAAGLCRSPRLHSYACVSEEEIKQHCPTFSILWSLIIMLCCRLNKSITHDCSFDILFVTHYCLYLYNLIIITRIKVHFIEHQEVHLLHRQFMA